MIFVSSIVVALAILAFLSWRDLHVRTRGRPVGDLVAESPEHSPPPQEQPVMPSPGLSPDEVLRTRRLYVNAFWLVTIGNLLLWMVGVAVTVIGALFPYITLLFLAIFLYATYRATRILGHDPLTCGLICVLVLVPFFALIQYIAIGHRFRQHFGPLGSVPTH